MTFPFTSGPAYVLYVICIVGFALIKDATFDVVATALFGALVWYTGRRAYKEVKLANITMTRELGTSDPGKGMANG